MSGRVQHGRRALAAQHVRPRSAPRPAAARPRGGRTARRFGPLGLVPAALLGLAGGALTATGLPGPQVGTALPVAGPYVVAATERPWADDAAASRAVVRSAAPETDRATATGPAPAATDAATADGPAVLDVPDPTVIAAPVPLGISAEDRMAGLLSLDVPQVAGGDLVVVAGASAAPNPTARVRTVRVEVEAGLAVDGQRFARLVMGILNNPQGWGADGSVSFARTDAADPDLRVVLASPDTTDALCAPLDTEGTFSCGRAGHAVINYLRWVRGAGSFPDVTSYRQYVVNHEVGHLLGHQHVDCPGPGELAPIMLQQTREVAVCTANGWPFPADR